LVQGWIVDKRIELTDSFVLHEELSCITDSHKLSIIMQFIRENTTAYVAADRIDEVRSIAENIMRQGIKYMDAAHLACAIVSKSDYFLTTDKRVLKLKSDLIQAINPLDFIRIQEENL
jgi:predicted nucleic acid-binding protein